MECVKSEHENRQGITDVDIFDGVDTKDKSVDLEELGKSHNINGEELNQGVSTSEIKEVLPAPVVEKEKKVGRPRKKRRWERK